MPLKIAIDVGTKHLAICAIRCSPNAGGDRTLLAAKRRLAECEVLLWEVVALELPKRPSFANHAEAVAAFVAQRRGLFEQASVVVIEQQMQATMRAVAAALFAAIRMIATCELQSQQSKLKLEWSDLSVVADDISTYARRKRAAVLAAHYLLDAKPQRSRLPPPNQSASATVLISSRKQDDLADALLHILAFDLRPTKRRRTQVACGPEVA